ncbi:hypothetical protein [Thalassotalea piscium]|uniref:Uncharacterized protein n=1 Tax=Thalassotalea piscium TaxID=1230533 RepID=A0A7X0NKI4_9GAMM|nr:hypothetical protein [Thalassotalea piscium]MBB6545127.1 hypothetical protein [Thalassotalea piscium]
MIKTLPILMLFTLDVMADGFSRYDEHKKLSGYYIVDAGNTGVLGIFPSKVT